MTAMSWHRLSGGEDDWHLIGDDGLEYGAVYGDGPGHPYMISVWPDGGDTALETEDEFPSRHLAISRVEGLLGGNGAGE